MGSFLIHAFRAGDRNWFGLSSPEYCPARSPLRTEFPLLLSCTRPGDIHLYGCPVVTVNT